LEPLAKNDVSNSLATLNKIGKQKVTIPAVVSANTVTASKIYFMMFRAKQSVIRIGYLLLCCNRSRFLSRANLELPFGRW
jgi:hypothetical protein